MKGRDVLFGGVDTGRSSAEFGRLLLRLFAGIALALAHGWGKIPPQEGFVGMVGGLGMPLPELSAWLSGIAEFVGGLLLAAGLLTRPAALMIVLNLTVAIVLAHAGDPFADRERAMLFAAIALCYLFTGAGRYSVDALIHPRDRTGRRSP